MVFAPFTFSWYSHLALQEVNEERLKSIFLKSNLEEARVIGRLGELAFFFEWLKWWCFDFFFLLRFFTRSILPMLGRVIGWFIRSDQKWMGLGSSSFWHVSPSFINPALYVTIGKWDFLPSRTSRAIFWLKRKLFFQITHYMKVS